VLAGITSSNSTASRRWRSACVTSQARRALALTSMGKLFLSFLTLEQRRRLLASTPLHTYTENTSPTRTLEKSSPHRKRHSTYDQEILAGVVLLPTRSLGERHVVRRLPSRLRRTMSLGGASARSAPASSATRLEATVADQKMEEAAKARDRQAPKQQQISIARRGRRTHSPSAVPTAHQPRTIVIVPNVQHSTTR